MKSWLAALALLGLATQATADPIADFYCGRNINLRQRQGS